MPDNPQIADLIALLDEVQSRITEGSDMLWGWYATPEALCSDLEKYRAELRQGQLACLKELELLFLPTAVFQEHSIQNGWSADYMVLSQRFDRLYDFLTKRAAL